MSSHRRPFWLVLAGMAAGVGCCAVVLLLFGSSLRLGEEVLHEESSLDAGVTYEYGGEQYSNDLLLVRRTSLAGESYELHLGHGAKLEYYPVRLEFGSGPPRIRDVEWRPEEVAVTFESGESVRVPADNFRSVR